MTLPSVDIAAEREAYRLAILAEKEAEAAFDTASCARDTARGAFYAAQSARQDAMFAVQRAALADLEALRGVVDGVAVKAVG